MNTKNIDKVINNDIIPIIVYNNISSNYKIQKQNNNIKIAMNKFTENNKQLKHKYDMYLNEFISKLKKHFYNDEESLYLNHELLHMASNKKINEKLIITGFGLIDFKKRKKYGIFIN